jgi:hypothetical protein
MQTGYNTVPEESGPSTEEFLSLVLPDTGFYFIVTPNPDGPGFIHYPLKTIPEMVAKAHALNDAQQNVYFACASYRDESYIGKDGKRHWRTGLNAGWVKSFWCEIDCGSDKAAAGKGYETLKQAGLALKAFCLANGLPIPTVVKSGGGLHCYWVFTETITKEDWLPVAFKFKALAKEGRAPLLADPSRTADIASVLRPVGTGNWKPARAGAVVTLHRVGDPMTFAHFQSAIEAAHAQMLADKPPSANDAATPYAGPGLPLALLADALARIEPDVPRDKWWGVLSPLLTSTARPGATWRVTGVPGYCTTVPPFCTTRAILNISIQMLLAAPPTVGDARRWARWLCWLARGAGSIRAKRSQHRLIG